MLDLARVSGVITAGRALEQVERHGTSLAGPILAVHAVAESPARAETDPRTLL